MGLLFLIVGTEGRDHKLIVSRFPADSGILAEANQQTLNVAFLERVFMKSAKAYKAVRYSDSSLTAGFWSGKAVDKQLNNPETQLSNYWIAEFLESDFRTTAAAGTRRLGVALREAAKKTDDLGVKSQISAAVTLANQLGGQMTSISDFGRQFRLSAETMGAISKEVRGAGTIDERFQFDLKEFTNQVAYRTIELDTGGLLTAEARAFDNVFQREVVDSSQDKIRFSTEGKVVNEKLGKGR
jgi:hypothetical protein